MDKCVHKFLVYFSVFVPGMIEAKGCCGFINNNDTCMLVRNIFLYILKGICTCIYSKMGYKGYYR